MISVVISAYLNRPDSLPVTKECVESLKGYDELIVFTHQGLGYCEAWNTAVSMAHGDYIVLISNDHVLKEGTIRDMAIEDTVTSPVGSGTGNEDKPFWGGLFCIPRNIYEKYGLYDMIYDEGIHYMDEDLLCRYQENNVKMTRVPSVNFDHKHPGFTLSKIESFSEKVRKNLSIFGERWKK